MVGADLSGIELRMLAHYLARYDGGRYADILLNGDIHQTNADKIGISAGKLVKTVTYAFLYGAGDEKIGTLMTNSYRPAKQRRRERRSVAHLFLRLTDWVNYWMLLREAATEALYRSIDGRKINVDSPHKALNYLLQSGAGVVAKQWMLINQQHIKKCALLLTTSLCTWRNYNLSAIQHTQKTFVHPWYIQLQQLERRTTCESASMQRQPPENNWSETH